MYTIQQSIEQLHGALRDYIEATYHISAKSLIVQRKALLNRPGVIRQIPYLESTPRYETGERFSEMAGLNPAALQAYLAVSNPQGKLPRLIYDPPYRHQSEAVRGSLIDGRNLIIMTGTGSGKTEAFLLPILGKLAGQASEKPDTFGQQPAMRALVLYPMNALVNDQLGRLRALFGDPRLVALFKGWAGRPPRFARYTSRTPYAGVRTTRKDSAKYKSFEEFYVDIERRARDAQPQERTDAQRLLQALKERGKWPAKPHLAAWLGEKGSRWQHSKTGAFVRAVTLPDDTELLTRHEVQAAPPDLLVTNYSMLEYMMMRPIERSIFDMTRAFLEANPDETFLIVLDEAHLYRGAAGAEVGLLLRRLRDRLGISAARFQVICATASFSDHAHAPVFGAQISGLPQDTFRPISGTLALRPHDSLGSDRDAEVLAAIDLPGYYAASADVDRLAAIKPLLDHRQVQGTDPLEKTLYHALAEFPPMGRLINTTMKQAVPVADLGNALFPTAVAGKADAAANALMALGSAARQDPKTPGLLPCRIHSFFRGLPGLWVCMDAECAALDHAERDGICGRMYCQPRDACECGARVLEFYSCRNCGTAYARAYTDSIDVPGALWPEPGESMRMAEGETKPAAPPSISFLRPLRRNISRNPPTTTLRPGASTRRRSDLVRAGSTSAANACPTQPTKTTNPRRRWTCAASSHPVPFAGRRPVSAAPTSKDHQTKGDQPFQALIARQLQVQPPFSAQTNTLCTAPRQEGTHLLRFATRLPPGLRRIFKCTQHATRFDLLSRGATAASRT